MSNLNDWVQYCRTRLSALEGDIRLESNHLVAHVAQRAPTQLFCSDASLTDSQQLALEQLIQRRLEGEPLAYLLGSAQFYGLSLKVDHNVLIPRSDTECMVAWLLEKLPADYQKQIFDLGTGSGAIALALKHHLPNAMITAVDASEAALNVAKQNADQLDLNIQFVKSNWLEGYQASLIDIIISNPPYIESNDIHLAHLHHEPLNALVAGEDGMADIKIIIKQAALALNPQGLLVIEHGYNQADAVRDLLVRAQFDTIQSHQDLSGINRFFSAQNPWRR